MSFCLLQIVFIFLWFNESQRQRELATGTETGWDTRNTLLVSGKEDGLVWIKYVILYYIHDVKWVRYRSDNNSLLTSCFTQDTNSALCLFELSVEFPHLSLELCSDHEGCRTFPKTNVLFFLRVLTCLALRLECVVLCMRRVGFEKPLHPSTFNTVVLCSRENAFVLHVNYSLI